MVMNQPLNFSKKSYSLSESIGIGTERAFGIVFVNIKAFGKMFSGDIELSPKWSAGISSGYDIKNQGITYTQLRFERDLLSWRMNFSWIPFSANKSWNFFIGIKSGMLSDIKYDKRRQRDKIL